MRTSQGATDGLAMQLYYEHPDNRCPKPAVTADGYCQECHDKAAKEDLKKTP